MNIQEMSSEELIARLCNAIIGYDNREGEFLSDKKDYDTYEAELLFRLEQRDSLKKEAQYWMNSRDGAVQTMSEMIYEVEKLKCCGNCGKHIDDFDDPKCKHQNAIYNNYCAQWVSDGLTREQREVK